MAENAAEDGLKRTIKDLTAGAAGGIAQVLLGKSFAYISVPFFSPFQLFQKFENTIRSRMIFYTSLQTMVICHDCPSYISKADADP